MASTVIPIGRYCPTNTIQANPYKNWGSGYPVDPSVLEQPLFGSTKVHELWQIWVLTPYLRILCSNSSKRKKSELLLVDLGGPK